jgi:biopolymer transport protein ExbD
MAMIDNTMAAGRQKAGVPKLKKVLPKVDMTPMVDLGFLLITFFIFTTEMSKPAVLPLVMPAPVKGPIDQMPVGKTAALTVLLDENDQLWYYSGDFENARQNNTLIKTGYGPDGIRKVIQQKQEQLNQLNYQGKGRDALVFIIKPGSNSSYKNAVDILDEVMITGVKTYVFAEVGEKELVWLQQSQ